MVSLLRKDRHHFPTKAALLASPFWRELKRRVIRKQQGVCGACGEARPLELHHRAYPYCGHPQCLGSTCWGYEQLPQMRALCRACHHAEHVDVHGNFWADPVARYHAWSPWYAARARGEPMAALQGLQPGSEEL